MKPNYIKNRTDIVVPQYGRPDLTFRLLESLQANTNSDQYRVILVDDGSPEQDFDVLLKDPKFVQLFRCTPEKKIFDMLFRISHFGPYTAINTGLKAVRSRYCIVMNNDVTVHDPQWIHELRFVLDISPIYAAVSPFTDNASGAAGRPPTTDHPVQLIRTGLPNFCTMYRTRVIWDLLRGYHEGFQLVGGDDDLHDRIRDAGYAIALATRAFVRHDHGGTRSSIDTAEMVKADRDLLKQRRAERGSR